MWINFKIILRGVMLNMEKLLNVFGYLAKIHDNCYWYSCCSTCISLLLLILDKHEIGFNEFHSLTAIIKLLYLGCWDYECCQCFYSVKCELHFSLGEKVVRDHNKIIMIELILDYQNNDWMTQWLNPIAAIYFVKNNLLYTCW